MNFENATKNIRKELKDYIIKHKLESLVIGVSGGIDSALVCALAKPICEELDIPLIGRSIPIISNKLDEMARAQLVGESFCTLFDAKNLDKLFYETSFEIFNKDDIITRVIIKGETEKKIKIREGNIKARLRMIYLYDLAQKYNGMVLGTDNYTEYLLGFFTLHGDHFDYGMIQYLWKTEVYEMSKWLIKNEPMSQRQIDALELCIDAIPTDGLGVSNSDFDQLGAKDYNEVDLILAQYLDAKNRYEKGEDVECPEINHSVIERHEKTHFKRNWPVNIPRDKIIDD